MIPQIALLFSPNWTDYELLDSGGGQKLERFGPYTFVRPEVQALWSRALPSKAWQSAHAVFEPSGEESGGHWKFNHPVADKWEMHYPTPPISSPSPSTPPISASEPSTPPISTPQPSTPPISVLRNGGMPAGQGGLRFWVQTTPGRHLGVFPEGAANWDWMIGQIQRGRSAKSSSTVNVLNLFGYTGLATLAAAAAGAQVTHIDASKKSVTWARENQSLSGLTDKPVRWIVDDAIKFVEREARRGVKYDGILLDPPKFGRGPKGEVWEVYKSLPGLLQACRTILNGKPLFVILTVYAVKLPAVHAYTALEEMLKGLGGALECGELVTPDKSANRFLSQAVYARWHS